MRYVLFVLVAVFGVLLLSLLVSTVLSALHHRGVVRAFKAHDDRPTS